MNVTYQQPNFGQNYDVGYVGFTSRTDDAVATGIAWFERWDVEGVDPGWALQVPVGITVEHALIVSGADECIEAHAGTGVQKSSLSKYFNDPHCRIFFRKPRKWSLLLGEDIVASAAKHIGDKYGYRVIVADALASTYIGRFLNLITFGRVNRFVSGFLTRKNQEVCSQLCAMALAENLPHLGCLAEPASLVTPQALFEDPVIFEPWAAAPPAIVPANETPDSKPLTTRTE